MRERLEELSSISEQRRLWLGSDGGEISSFDEAVSVLFDDAGVGEALESGDIERLYGGEFSKHIRHIDNIISKMKLRSLSRIPYIHTSDEEIIDSAEMDEIRLTAKSALMALE